MRTLFTCLLALAFLTPAPACHNVTPDQFWNATVDCAKVNPESSAALGAIETCLLGVVSQDYAVCLSGLVTEGKFTIDEVACVVAALAQRTNVRVSTASATPADLALRKNANDWLAQHNISIRNSYTPAK
jgi:hypothetical protein